MFTKGAVMKKMVIVCTLSLAVGLAIGYFIAAYKKQKTIDKLLWISLNDNMNNMLILADAYRRNDVDDVLKGTEGIIATELMLNRKFPGGYRQEYINSSGIIDRINEFVLKYPDSVLKDAIKSEN
jgi:hypothetical protein